MVIIDNTKFTDKNINEFTLINKCKLRETSLYVHYKKGSESAVEIKLVAESNGVTYDICNEAGEPVAFKFNTDVSKIIPVRSIPVCDELAVRVNFTGTVSGEIRLSTKR